MARTLLNQYPSSVEVITELMELYGVSRRHAYRYVQEAQKSEQTLQIPEQKIVFTVKLPPSLIQHVRDRAKVTGQSISDLTANALERFLHDGEKHG
jgi:transcriptional antiterminator